MWRGLVNSVLLIAFVRASSSSETNIVNVWERNKELTKQHDWNRDIRQCKIKEVCPEHSKNCEGKVMWEKVGKRLNRLNSTEVIVLDDRTMYQASFNHTLTQKDVDQLKDHLCDMTLIRRNVKKGCLILWIPNQCPWESFTEEAWPYSKDCDVKTINSEDAGTGSFPRDCSKGPGWNGTLETFVEGDSYKINWASLVKQPACVEQLTLLDERAKEKKEFVTTWIDLDFPIEYKESACNLTIKIEDSSTTCFTFNSKVKCEADLDRKRGFRMEPREELRDDSSTLTVAIICATVLAVTVVIAITVISTVILFVKKKEIVEQERQREEEERNDLYGTYYQGVEYNTVIDNNPRYNEDEGNADAVVTDNGKTSYRGAEYSVASESVKIF